MINDNMFHITNYHIDSDVENGTVKITLAWKYSQSSIIVGGLWLENRIQKFASVENGPDMERSIGSIKSGDQHRPELWVQSWENGTEPVGQLTRRPAGGIEQTNRWQASDTAGVDVAGDQHRTSQRPSGQVTPLEQQQPVGVG